MHAMLLRSVFLSLEHVGRDKRASVINMQSPVCIAELSGLALLQSSVSPPPPPPLLWRLLIQVGRVGGRRENSQSDVIKEEGWMQNAL